MNKLKYLFLLLLFVSALQTKAQTSSGTPVTERIVLQNKLKKSNAGVEDVKKNIKPGFWISRAELLMDIFDLNRQYLPQGTPQLNVTLLYGNAKDIKTWEKDGSLFEQYNYEFIEIVFKDKKVDSFKELQIIHEDPLPVALSSLEKAEELDIEKKETKDLKKNYERLTQMVQINGAEKFGLEDYKGSYNSFLTIVGINQKAVMENKIDTAIFYFTGITASKAQMSEESIKYYELAKSYNYPEPSLYSSLKAKYFEIGDTAKGVKVLVEGFEKYPGDQGVLIELINYYLIAGKGDDALNYLKIAKDKDPGNISFIFAEATLYDKMGNTEKALESYQQCIDINPEYFDAYFNIGVMYFNQAVKINEELNANTKLTQKEYDVAKVEADAVLSKAIPFMEKANQLAETNTTWTAAVKQENIKATLDTLKTLYYRLKMDDKYKEVQQKLESM